MNVTQKLGVKRLPPSPKIKSPKVHGEEKHAYNDYYWWHRTWRPCK